MDHETFDVSMLINVNFSFTCAYSMCIIVLRIKTTLKIKFNRTVKERELP